MFVAEWLMRNVVVADVELGRLFRLLYSMLNRQVSVNLCQQFPNVQHLI